MAKQFDMAILHIGHYDFVVPKAAALHFLELCTGSDIYKLDSHWTGEGTENHARPLPEQEMPSVRLIGPAQFMQAIELRKAYEEEQKRKKAADA